jgi:decaprenylphospho-beta-D-ribofuranose 2-oxidase
MNDYRFRSFDGCTTVDGRLLRPDRYRFFSGPQFPTKAIARGAGLSYAAASFGQRVASIDHAEFNRILAFSKQEAFIEIEAGATLGQLYNFLIEHNLFLATQPGHPRITIGGCIAADIHGKNQFMDGTFINQVISLSLYHPDHGILQLSASENPDLFRLTCGGYGLTGNILSARLKLKSVPSPGANMSLRPISSMTDLGPELVRSAASADFVFSWHDFTADGKNFGKGFIQEGRFCCGTDVEMGNHLNQRAIAETLSAESRALLPVAIFNLPAVKIMNFFYGRMGTGPGCSTVPLFDCIFPIQGKKELYFTLFGKQGFHEYQVVVPEANFMQYVSAVQDFLKRKPLPITLASGKLFAGRQDLLRFTGDGICLALNFPRQKEAEEFISHLDRLVLECRGIPNIIKDSRLPASLVEAAYPEYGKFKHLLRQFDRNRRYQSELSERLGL